VEHIFSSALFVTPHNVQSKSYYLQIDPTLFIHNGSKIIVESNYQATFWYVSVAATTILREDNSTDQEA